MDTPYTCGELQKLTDKDGERTGFCHAQIAMLRDQVTSAGKPYFDAEFMDSLGKIKLKFWGDTPAFEVLKALKLGDAVEISGKFFANNYGLNLQQPEVRVLNEEEEVDLYSGSPEKQIQQEEDWQFLKEQFGLLEDPRLRMVCSLALEKYEKKWRRAAAARTYHHSRRGGLLEHTAQMVRCAQAIAPLYVEVFPDLLFAGVLFHDIGKLWENDYEEKGFQSPYSTLGELMGHINLGVEVLNQLWREASEQQPESFAENIKPPEDLLRYHLIHLILSHHGQKEFGAPVSPRTPEAWILHHIDNIDAKIEMLRCAYVEKPQVGEGLYERRPPLEGILARPVKYWNSGSDEG
jgi:3'-5' exoribonuclease